MKNEEEEEEEEEQQQQQQTAGSMSKRRSARYTVVALDLASKSVIEPQQKQRIKLN